MKRNSFLLVKLLIFWDFKIPKALREGMYRVFDITTMSSLIHVIRHKDRHNK
jgi:hypothetical protein